MADQDDPTLVGIIPLLEERLRVDKRVVETGRVRVSVRTEIDGRVARETLSARRVEVERVPIGREVSEAPSVRREGDVTVIPVLEEILVVEKRLVLKEEIRLRTVVSNEAVEHAVDLRVQRAEIVHLPAAGAPPADRSAAPLPGTPAPLRSVAPPATDLPGLPPGRTP